MNAPARVLEAVLRRSFQSFAFKSFNTLNPGTLFRPNWHIEALCHHLEECQLGLNNRLLVTVPPRSLKSTLASIAFPAFVLGHAPTKRIVCVSYGSELSLKFARDTRTLMSSRWYKDVYSKAAFRKETESELETTEGGGRYGTSVGGTLTGRGGDFLIVDDPMKADDAFSKAAREKVSEYYRSVLFSRLDDKASGCIIVIMQRLHEEDLAGDLIRQGGFVHLNLPAIAMEEQSIPIGQGRVHVRGRGDVLQPDREPLLVLEEIKRSIGAAAFQAQYQQSPVPEAGNLLKRNWLKYYSSPPARLATDEIVQSWDTAMKGAQQNDYSVCTTWLVRGEDCYLMEVSREHLDYPALVKAATEHHHRWQPDAVLIEDQGSGTSLLQELSVTHGLRPIAIKPERDKVTRFSAATIAFEKGQVCLPANAPWLDELLNELMRFPQSRFDDQVDSVSQFLNWRKARIKPVFDADFGWDEVDSVDHDRLAQRILAARPGW